MKALITPSATMIALLLTISSCENINRESKDVSTNAATISADTLETMDLTAIGEANDPEVAVVEKEVAVEAVAPKADDGRSYTETEVVQIDTISTRIVYDIKRRMIEEVDTVGATKTYEIRRKVLRRTVMLDTLTETKDEERTVAYQEGNYKVLDEQVETDTAVEVLDYAEAKREAAKERAKAASAKEPAPTTQPATTTVRENTTNQPAQATQPEPNATVRENVVTQPADQSTTNRVDTTSTSRLPVPPADNQREQTRETPTRPATGTTVPDTTRSDSGS